MTDNSISINVENITKTFRTKMGGREFKALDNVSLSVKRGDIFGLLGPNGAGKTTLIKILLGSLSANSGSGHINGFSILRAEARQKIGFLPENHRFPLYHTGMQTLYCFGGLSGLSRAEIKEKSAGLLALVGMEKWASTKIKKYSKGMMQRLGLAQAMLNDPDLLFLDEPTDGVDPVGRREIRDILKDLQSRGKTIFLNSHLLAEVESICDNVAVLNHGKVIKTGPAVGLVTTKPTFIVETGGFPLEVKEKITEEIDQAEINEHKIKAIFEEDREINRLIDLLRDNGVEILAVLPQKISLEDSFIQLIKGQAQSE